MKTLKEILRNLKCYWLQQWPVPLKRFFKYWKFVWEVVVFLSRYISSKQGLASLKQSQISLVGECSINFSACSNVRTLVSANLEIYVLSPWEVLSSQGLQWSILQVSVERIIVLRKESWLRKLMWTNSWALMNCINHVKLIFYYLWHLRVLYLYFSLNHTKILNSLTSTHTCCK